MKGNIKTANDCLDNEDLLLTLGIRESVIKSMKEYAEQFIDLAAEGARTKTSKTMWQGMSDFVEITEIDKESILKVKQLIK